MLGEPHRIAATAARWRWPLLRSRGSLPAMTSTPSSRISAATLGASLRSPRIVHATSAATLSR